MTLLREGLRELIHGQSDMAVVGEAESGNDAVCKASELCPDIVLMDIALHDLNGMEATRQIRINTPETKVIVLAMRREGRFVRQMLGAGATGYVFKDSCFAELADAIRIVFSGRVYLSHTIGDLLLGDYIRQLTEEPVHVMSLVSDREREVLHHLTEGLGNKDIAIKLGVSVTTIDSHRKHIMDKLGIRSIAGLTKYAIREGITSCE